MTIEEHLTDLCQVAKGRVEAAAKEMYLEAKKFCIWDTLSLLRESILILLRLKQ